MIIALFTVLFLTSLIPYTQDGVSLEIDTPDDFPDSLAIEDLFESEYKAMRVLKKFVASNNVGNNCTQTRARSLMHILTRFLFLSCVFF